MNDRVTAALRALVSTGTDSRVRGTRSGNRWPQWVIIFDTETTTDHLQRLLFGCYHLARWDGDHLTIVEEGLIYADDLQSRDPAGYARLVRYAERRLARVTAGDVDRLQLMSRSEFVEDVLWRFGYKTKALIVGFNLPFDLSRLAVDVGAARGKYRRGFSFALWGRRKNGRFVPHPYRPRLTIRVIDSKRSFFRFTRPRKTSYKVGAGKDRKMQPYPGRFLDLRTLAFALTDTSHSLASACMAFRTRRGKGRTEGHGKITAKYIDYNRRDVAATAELLVKLRQEFDRHPIPLAAWEAYSPASISKAYLTAMGVTPLRAKFVNVKAEDEAMALIAYYGGRAEARIRRAVAPVLYVDILSMYPTVNTLMGLWGVLTAKDLQLEDATRRVRKLLAGITLDECFDPTIWPDFTFYAQVEPTDDVLPIRAQYDPDGDQWGIGVNHVTSDDAIWYAGPDIVASTLLTGRPPRIRKAVRLVPSGRQSGMRTVKLRGAIPIRPYLGDFFRSTIEARKALSRDQTLSQVERDRHGRSLKVVANSGSYGILVEMNREDRPVGERSPVTVHGLNGAFPATTSGPETPGVFCFPVVGALIPSAARLIVAMMERCVTDLGGAYAFCDTDSMAIVAAEVAGLWPCIGGPEQIATGEPAIRVLSRADVLQIVERFDALNPYDRTFVTDTVLQIEDENYRPGSTEFEQLYAYVISAKRYVLFNRRADGTVVIRKASEHGLGHVTPPLDREQWIADVWQWILADAMGDAPPEPTWTATPSVAQTTISSPHVYRPFDQDRSEVPYDERIKPMNFVMSASIARFGHPVGVDEKHFHLAAPFCDDPSRWMDLSWFDTYSRNQYRVTTDSAPDPDHVRIRSLGQLLAEYRVHPEAKSAAPDGGPCREDTIGLLRRRHLTIDHVVYIGKESNRVEEVQQGLHHDPDDVLDMFEDPSRDVWTELIQPFLHHIPRKAFAEATGLSVRRIQSLRQGQGRPLPDNLTLIATAVFDAAWAIRTCGGSGAKLQLARRIVDSARIKALVDRCDSAA